MARSPWFLLTLAACGKGELSTGDSDSTPTSDTGPVPNERSPVVEKVSSADCYLVDPDESEAEAWSVQILVDDPQDDVASLGSTVEILNDGDSLATYDLACTDELCTGTWKSTDDDVTCEVGQSSTFRFVVVDKEGNVSAPFDYEPS